MEQQRIERELWRLLNSKSNDAVKLAYFSQEDADRIDKLDLRGLVELKRSEKGAVEVKLIDRVRIIELLEQLEQREREEKLGSLLDGLREGEGL